MAARNLRRAPSRFFDGAPAIVRDHVAAIYAIKPAAPLDYDVVFLPVYGEDYTAQASGLDFDAWGARGCHWFLHPVNLSAYRKRNQRNRVVWRDLPVLTQRAILRYLNEPA